MDPSALCISSPKFSYVINQLRQFCLSRGFIEVHTQNRLSILAACEDPTTVQTYQYGGKTWPLPQTGQMWLEWELLRRPETPGFFCVSTSYRYEQHPVEGRHMMIFPMFEFEFKGGMDALLEFERDLIEHLGFKRPDAETVWPEGSYEQVANLYNTPTVENEHERRLYDDFGSVFFLRDFPEHTSPFWNMARGESGLANKVDVIMGGMETIGSAERSCDPEDMRRRFATISEGGYAGLLYELFGRQRVDAELDEFLEHSFIKRSGGGIGVTRLIRAMEMAGLIPNNHLE
jgi:aspartyl/asparaginyl-tRNA synthetase